MDDDLRRGLLTKKGGFEKMYEDGLIRVAKIRQQNDAFQKHMGPDIDEDLRQQIEQQSSFIEKQINGLKNLLNQMQTKYRDPESKNKIKQLKGDAQKQIERNKIILKDIIRQSFERRSFGKGNEEDSSQLIEGGAIDYTHLNGVNGSASKNSKKEKESLLTDPPQQQEEEQQQHIMIDYEVERKMMLQKSAMMDEVQQKTQMINQIINEQGVMVEQQGQNLDVISQQLINTNKNLTQTNENLEQAAGYQKKSKKKYVILVIIIIVVLIIVAGIVFFSIK